MPVPTRTPRSRRPSSRWRLRTWRLRPRPRRLRPRPRRLRPRLQPTRWLPWSRPPRAPRASGRRRPRRAGTRVQRGRCLHCCAGVQCHRCLRHVCDRRQRDVHRDRDRPCARGDGSRSHRGSRARACGSHHSVERGRAAHGIHARLGSGHCGPGAGQPNERLRPDSRCVRASSRNHCRSARARCSRYRRCSLEVAGRIESCGPGGFAARAHGRAEAGRSDRSGHRSGGVCAFASSRGRVDGSTEGEHLERTSSDWRCARDPGVRGAAPRVRACRGYERERRHACGTEPRFRSRDSDDRDLWHRRAAARCRREGRGPRRGRSQRR